MVRCPVVDEFLELIKSVKNQKWGGCLVTCYAFYRWLEHNGLSQESFFIVQYDSNYEQGNTEQNLAWIVGECDEASSANHFTFLYGEHEYDSSGHYRGKNNRTVLSALTEEDLVEEFCLSALNNSTWNGDFVREEAIPQLELLLGFDLSEIDHESSW
tara:strand:- start:265 stop:735 length:471 start_codon:yes stop_codon:yes gene_type:complete